MQVECVKDDDWLLHVEDLTDEHDLCEPGYPRLEAYADGVWHFKVQVRFMSDCHVLHDISSVLGSRPKLLVQFGVCQLSRWVVDCNRCGWWCMHTVPAHFVSGFISCVAR